MGFLSKLFKKDPQEELAKLEAMIGRGEDAEKAHQLAQKLVGSDQPQVAERARGLAEKLGAQLAAEYRANAERSLSSGNYQDALDWLSSALAVAPPALVEELEQQIEALTLKSALAGDRPAIGQHAAAFTAGAEDDHAELDDETHFEMLLGMFREEVAEVYRNLPSEFHQGFLDFNNGRLEEALARYRTLAPSLSPYLGFELGRCLLQLDQSEEAVAWFERIQQDLGDTPLDEAGTLCLPLVWAEAKLRLDKPEEAIARIEPLADPRNGEEGMLFLYARALQAADRLQDAKRFLAQTYKLRTGNPLFCVMLAQVVAEMGDWDAAVDLLEKRVDAGRRYASGSGISAHPAPIRALAALYLEQTKTLPKAGEQLLQLEQMLKGLLTREDWLLTARYYELIGDDENAAFASEAAEQAGAADTSSSFGALRSGDQAVL